MCVTNDRISQYLNIDELIMIETSPHIDCQYQLVVAICTYIIALRVRMHVSPVRL